MPTSLGAHNARIEFARELLTKKGRREHGRFSFEGATLLAEALAAGTHVESIFATNASYAESREVRDAEANGVPVYLVDERTIRRISDVESPAGVVAVAPIVMYSAAELLDEPGLILALADLSDPGNAGTLLRTAEAFGVTRVIFGSRGAEPHLPKVVRAAMGALFRLRIAVATPADVNAVLADWQVTGLAAHGEPLGRLAWHRKAIVAVGSERRGLEGWESLCGRFASIPMAGGAESLNAGVAGSIALYEASKHPNV